MKRSITVLAGIAVVTAALSGPAFSQGTPQTLSLMKVDPQSLATGYRASKVVGSVVPYSALEVHDQKMMLRGATKESLKSLPEFKYST